MADTSCKNFIMKVVYETWYKKLKDPDTFYTNVTFLKLLDHLTEVCSGLHTVNAVNILQLMEALFTNTDGIPQFINAMESAQQKSMREYRTIIFYAVALKSLIQSGDYETKMREWSKLPNIQKTWMALKTNFREAYEAKQHTKAAQEGE